MAVDPDTQTPYVTSGNSVTVVGIASGSITGAIEVGRVLTALKSIRVRERSLLPMQPTTRSR